MRFSLVLATIGRSDDVARFLDSLNAQVGCEVQLIVVDQNKDDRIERLLAGKPWIFEVLHLRSTPGLSYARNVGLKHVDGDIVAFPDDDCWYGPGLLLQVQQALLSDATIDGVTGRSVDEHMAESGGRFSRVEAMLDDYNVWSSAISYTIFLRAAVCQQVTGGFDEALGVGAKTRFGSGEETDYLIRAIRSGARLRYWPQLTVFHPNKLMALGPSAMSRALTYGMGMGRVLVKHAYPWHYRVKVLARPLIGALAAALTLQAGLCRFRWATASGRLRGMLAND